MRHLPVMLVLVAALGAAAPAAAAGDLDEAERQVERFEGELGEATEAYEQTWAELETVRTELVRLEARAGELAEEADEMEERLGERARTMFMRGATGQVQAMLSAEGPQTAIERAGMFSLLQRRDTASLEEAVAARGSLEQTEQLVADRQERLQELEADLDVHSTRLQRRLGAAQQDAEELRTREERRREVNRGEQEGTYACMFEPGAFNFRDTWGDPRSGGRSHKGTDVFARMSEPVYAFTDGVIQRHSRSGLGGIGLYLRGDDGNLYYYAHLEAIEDAGAVGRRVEAGDRVARNGATGNADRSAPHVHFELHPGGGAAVNPYPWLSAACH